MWSGVYNSDMVARGSTSADDLIARLGQLGDLRVWSVIITIFGDAVMPRGGVVPASALSALTDRLGIRPEALRVALYRLAKDGWITRRKSGRNSFYGLSETGAAEFLSASRRIYARAPQLHGPWRLAALPHLTEPARAAQDKLMRAAGFLPLSPVLFLAPVQAGKPPAGAAVVEGDFLAPPDWARKALGPQPLQQDYARLEAALADTRKSITRGTPIQSLEAAALRVLVIHQWRRLLLRHADLPPEVLPKAWRGEACRAAVLALHETLSPEADLWLDQAIGQHNG